MKNKLLVVIAMLFFATAIQAQMLPQTITADSLMAAMKCPDATCANAFATNNHFYLKVKTNVGGLQHVYEGNETYMAEDSTCSLPDGLSIIMEKNAITEITYSTVVKSTYTDIVNYFVKYGFHTILTETEDGVVYTTMESNEIITYRIIIGTETKVVDGKNCAVYTITIKFT